MRNTFQVIVRYVRDVETDARTDAVVSGIYIVKALAVSPVKTHHWLTHWAAAGAAPPGHAVGRFIHIAASGWVYLHPPAGAHVHGVAGAVLANDHRSADHWLMIAITGDN